MKKRSKEEWKELIAEYKGSGQQQSEWCKTKNINLNTFRNSIGKYRDMKGTRYKTELETRNTESSQEVKWLTVEPEDKPSEAIGKLEVKMGEFTILAEGKINEDTFMNVCKVLKRLC